MIWEMELCTVSVKSLTKSATLFPNLLLGGQLNFLLSCLHQHPIVERKKSQNLNAFPLTDS